MEALILNPICPFSLSHRPLVLPGYEQVTVSVGAQRTPVMLTVDGHIDCAIQTDDAVRVLAAPYRLRVAGSERKDFYDILKSKLSWSGGSDA
jgi:NAD+ kinase